VILVAAGTVRAEHYRPPAPSPEVQARRKAAGRLAAPRLAIVTGHLDMDLEDPIFTAGASRPIIVTVAAAPEERRAAAAEVADVLVAGDIFATTQYPFIDTKNGGTVQGLIRALNSILNLTVFRHQGEGGTYVVPGHGYLSDEHEVVEYRDMAVIVRDRVKAMKDGGATLAQIQAARVTADYDTRYGANAGSWTTAMFVQAIYDTLNVQPSPR